MENTNSQTLFDSFNPFEQHQEAEKIRAALEGFTFHTSTSLVKFTDEKHEQLAGRFLWEDGAQRIYLSEEAEEAGVLFSTGNALKQERPEIWEKIAQTHNADEMDNSLNAVIDDSIVLYIPPKVNFIKEFLLDLILSENSRAVLTNLCVFIDQEAQAVFTINLYSKKNKTENFFGGALNVCLSKGSSLILNEIQDLHRNAFAAVRGKATLLSDSKLQWHICELGARRARGNTLVHLKEAGAEAQIFGLYFPSKDQLFELHTRQDHCAPNTISNLYYKGAIKDNASADWQGMITVAIDAVKTDGYQKNENLLLSPNAHINAKPGLEILTDDVKCSHGTTISDIDENQLFYLSSRGIPLLDAERLIIQGFFDTTLNKISYEPIRNKLQEKIYSKMEE